MVESHKPSMSADTQDGMNAFSNGEWNVSARLLSEPWRDGFLNHIAYDFYRTTNGNATWTISIPLNDTECLIESMHGQYHSWRLKTDYYQNIVSAE